MRFATMESLKVLASFVFRPPLCGLQLPPLGKVVIASGAESIKCANTARPTLPVLGEMLRLAALVP